MNNYSSDYTQTVLNLSEILKARMIQNAVCNAAESGLFSLLDIYRELGYKPAASHEWYNKTTEFELIFCSEITRYVTNYNLCKRTE